MSVAGSSTAIVEGIEWKGRDATRLSNELIELTTLTRGGHLAAFRFREDSGLPSQNVLWEAPWMSSSSSDSADAIHETAGITGHGLCLDYFGPPSKEKAAAGLGIHGEAAAASWARQDVAAGVDGVCSWQVWLPVARLGFERTLRLRTGESVVYVEETVHNRRNREHACQWVQHVTFGPPFLSPGDTTFAASATRGVTSPVDYAGRSLLAIDKEFQWPHAPRRGATEGAVDLRKPFTENERGFVAGVQLDPQRQMEFLLAIDWKMRLGVGYCFRRQDFPWMAIWEENCARSQSPWNGSTQARGMEFGTTPLPVGLERSSRSGELFDQPTWCVIPANGKKTARYLMFLFSVPNEVHSATDVAVAADAITIRGKNSAASIVIPASGCEEFLFPEKVPDPCEFAKADPAPR